MFEIIFLATTCIACWIAGVRSHLLVGAMLVVCLPALAAFWQGLNALPFTAMVLAIAALYAGNRRRVALDRFRTDFARFRAEEKEREDWYDLNHREEV